MMFVIQKSEDIQLIYTDKEKPIKQHMWPKIQNIIDIMNTLLSSDPLA